MQFDATTQSQFFFFFFFFFAMFPEQLYETVPSLTSLECSSSHDVYFCDSFAASLCVKNELELEYKDRATLLVTQTLQVVQGRTPNHLDLLNLKWTLVCRNPSSWSSSYREGARERYQCLQSTKREARIKLRQVHTKVFIISTFVFFGIQNIEKRRNNMESLN